MKYLFTACFSLLFSVYSYSQTTITEFPKEPVAFTKELSNLLSTTQRDDCKKIAENFSNLQKTGKIDASQMEGIIKTSNTLLKEKMRPYPHFSGYIDAIITINNAGITSQFSSWNKVIDGILFDQKRGSYNEFTDFIDFSKSLFEKNALYDSKARTWIGSTKEYTFSYENKKPKVTFPAQTLTAYSSVDTQKIENTTGSLFPLEKKWEGNNGKVDWARAGLPEVYAEIKKPYTVQLDKSEINIDTVTFYHKQLFKSAINGSYQDRVMSQQGNRSYPRFTSFDKDVAITDIGPNVTFNGAFRMEGNNIYGTGDDVFPAVITFANDQGKKVITAKSTQFLIKKGEELSSPRAQLALTLNNDSITHPGVRMIFRFKDKELSLYRENSGIGAAPFYDSYHKKEIETDAIIWKINQPNIDLKMMSGGDKNAMELTSDNYYRKGEIEKYQTIKDVSPIHLLKRYSDEVQGKEFLAENFAKRMDKGYTESTIKNLLYKMMEDGFIFYDAERGLITVNEKTFNYVMAASGKKDYDIIKINSFSNSTNAQINVDSKDMAVAGVAMITLSDTSNVYLFPKEKGVTLKEGQDMELSGNVFAGRIDFEGEGFYFDYDSFKIDMQKLASAVINIPSGKKDKQGDAEFVPMRSKIEGLTGFLNVDHPKNKSGKQRIEKYPIFTNLKTSYVYYDKKEIRDSAYLRSKFYFEIEPFTFDSLNSFDPYLADLKGQLVSAGIFPNFKENLTVQEDLSWGFKRLTPKEGFPIYGGKGTYTDSILLSNNGLQGRGHVKHLFLDFNSNDILFTPDSLNAISDTFLMKKDKIGSVTFPIVKGKNNFIHWLPYKDTMNINVQTEPLLMYEDGASLKGNIVFTQKGLTGNGKFEFTEATLESALYKFSSDQLQSDTMSMEIKSIGGDQVTFKTPNVRGKVDFVKRIGEFKANNEDIPTEFTNNFFKTNINEFFWDMDKKILDFKSPSGSPGAYFTSTHAQKDSLRFMAKRGIFDMTNSIIKVEEVSRFYVADAEIQPDSNKATILPGGNIDTLRNAVIIADTLNKYHRIYDATLYVDARNKYDGTGKYDYRYGDMKKIINLSKISVKEDKLSRKKKAFTTYAEGIIEETDSFKIHPDIDFKGMASFVATDTGVTFDGYAKMKIGAVQTDWFSFKDKIDPNNFVLHYDKPVTPSGDTLTAGFSYGFVDTTGNAGLYMRLMTPKKDKEDFDVIATTGILKHNSTAGVYSFGDENKITKLVPKGNVLYFNEKQKTATAEGKIDIGLQLKPINIVSTGNINYEIDSNRATLKLLLGMNLPLDKTLITQFATDVNGFSFDKPNVDVNNSDFENAYAEIFSEKGYKGKLEDLRKTGTFPLPKEMQSNIIFSHLTLVFDPNFQIYRSVGPIGVAYIGETPIMKMINGYVEFGQRKFNDFFHIYLESSFSDWYYISCQNNILMAVSSKEDFNKLLAAIPNEKRQIPLTKDKKVFFLYTIGSAGAKESFLYRSRMIAEAKWGATSSDVKDESYYMMQELEEIKKQLLQDEQTMPDNINFDAPPQMLFDIPSDSEEPPMNIETPDRVPSDIPTPVQPEKGKGKKGKGPVPAASEQGEQLPTMLFEKPSEPIKEEPPIENTIREEPPVQEEVPVKEESKPKAKKEKSSVKETKKELPVEETIIDSPVETAPVEVPKEVAPVIKDNTEQEEPPMSNPDENSAPEDSKKKKKKG
jgi:hypothetical protein